MRAKRKARRRSVALFMFLTIGLMFGAVSYKRASLESKKSKLEGRRQEMETQKATLQKEKERIEEYGAYVDSTKFVEDTARDKLGLLYPNEVVFKPKKD